MIFISYDAEIEKPRELSWKRQGISLTTDRFPAARMSRFVQGAQAYQHEGQLEALLRNSMDGSLIHALSTSPPPISRQLTCQTLDGSQRLGWRQSHEGRGVNLGGGHAMVESPQRPDALTVSAKTEPRRHSAPTSVEKAWPRAAHQHRRLHAQLFIFPNLILISLCTRPCVPSILCGPDYMEIVPGRVPQRTIARNCVRSA